MAKKVIVVSIVVVLLVAAGVFMGMRRSHMMGGAQNASGPGGLVAVSVDGTPIPPADAALKLPENTAQQDAAGLRISLALNPYPPSGTQSSDFDVTLADANGDPVSDAAISLDLTMPGMWMPPNQLDLKPVSAGQYHAAGRFTMRGLWRIEVIITRNGEKQSVFFDVWL